MIKSLHSLRGVAALLVVLFHWRYLINADVPGLGDRLIRGGYSGIDLFFIISGFVMVIATAGAQRSLVRPFLIRRAFRVIPLATAATLFAYLISTGADRRGLLTSLLFLPRDHAAPPPGYGYALNIPQWTLGYELLFYAIFAAAIAISPRGRTAVAGTIIVALVILIQLATTGAVTIRPFAVPEGIFDADPSGILAMLGNPIMLEFIIGMVVAEITLTGRTFLSAGAWRAAVGLATVLTIVALITDFPGASGVLGWGAMMAALFLPVVFYEKAGGATSSPMLLKLGDWSYSIYISHLLVSTVVGSFLSFTTLENHISGLDRIPLFLAVTLAVSALLHRYLELPCIAFGRRLCRASMPGPVPSAAE